MICTGHFLYRYRIHFLYLVSHFLMFLLKGLFQSSFQVPHHKDLSWGTQSLELAQSMSSRCRRNSKGIQEQKIQSTFPTAWCCICKSKDVPWINDQLVSLIYIKFKTLVMRYMGHYVLLIWISCTFKSELSFNAVFFYHVPPFILVIPTLEKGSRISSLQDHSKSIRFKSAWEKWSSSPFISCLELRPFEMELVQS